MITAIVFLPLLGAIGAGIFALMKNDTGGFVVSISAMVLSMVLGWVAFLTMAVPGADVTLPLGCPSNPVT